MIVARSQLLISAQSDDVIDSIYRVLASIHDVDGQPVSVIVLESERELEE